MRYNNATLIEYCSSNNIQLTNEYKDVKIIRESYIEGKCIIEGCSNNFNKNFRQLVKTGAYCKGCMEIIATNKIKNSLVKWNIKILQDFCNENQIILLKDYSEIFINRNTIIEGFCLKVNCKNIFRKSFRQLIKINGYCEYCSKENGKLKIVETNINKFGVTCALLNDNVKEKSKNTMLTKYGVEHNSQSEKIKEQKKIKSIEKYGVEHPLKCPQIREDIKSTNLLKYGYENPQQNKEIHEKTLKTNFKKYGTNYYLQTDECKEKIIQTNLIKYGVEHHSQNAEVADTLLKNSYKLKYYELPSGKVLEYQGYENFALDDLLFVEKIKEEDIVSKRSLVPEIWYEDSNNKRRRHYVDFYIPSQNRCIEVKSLWTNQQKNNVLEKQKAGKNLGYNYDIWIYDKKGNKLNIL